MVVLLWIVIFGVMIGLRSMLPMALLSWGAWRGEIPLTGTRLAFLGNPWVLTLFIILALIEIGLDKYPNTPNRTMPAGISVRALMGALAGSALAVAGLEMWWKGLGAGVFGALVGTVLGYSLRQYFVDSFRCKDFYVAIGEDIVTLIGVHWVFTHIPL
jgi:uncharacterized membrane protein